MCSRGVSVKHTTRWDASAAALPSTCPLAYHGPSKSNEVCPSKWKDEGDKTLVNPGAKMVGKVHEALQK
ncbi:MAG: hypothetical protein DMD89_23035 [Candidatus Rokuibacteriota bacterium]|nr:MAG: hypothetical protein DMD89_23035 [Candidatus Rokubacteria bacterium]